MAVVEWRKSWLWGFPVRVLLAPIFAIKKFLNEFFWKFEFVYLLVKWLPRFTVHSMRTLRECVLFPALLRRIPLSWLGIIFVVLLNKVFHFNSIWKCRNLPKKSNARRIRTGNPHSQLFRHSTTATTEHSAFFDPFLVWWWPFYSVVKIETLGLSHQDWLLSIFYVDSDILGNISYGKCKKIRVRRAKPVKHFPCE